MRIVVTVADGPWYDGGVYVLVRVLRHLGCQLPIQSWYATGRDNDPRVRAYLENLGTEFRELPENIGGFASKCFPAIWPTLQSDSAEVMYLDSDCYPIYDPTIAFDWPEYKRHGALFWPNFRSSNPAQWNRLGLAAPPEPEFETGEYIVDTARVSGALRRAHELCNDPKVFGPIFRDDQECLHAGFVMTDTPYTQLKTPPKHDLHTIINHGPDGKVFTQHRVADKFRLKNFPCFWTKQRGDEMIRYRNLINEDLHFGFFDDFAALVGHDGPVPGFPWCCKCQQRHCDCAQRKEAVPA